MQGDACPSDVFILVRSNMAQREEQDEARRRTVAGRTEDSWMAGASVTTTSGPDWPGRPPAAELPSAAEVDGPASSAPCSSSSVSLIACAGQASAFAIFASPVGAQQVKPLGWPFCIPRWSAADVRCP